MYKLHLILKYLLKRRIAWAALGAVLLCTTMVLVVISVMGGWLTMFKSSFRGLSGDIVIHADSLRGFAYYSEIIAAIKSDPACQVKAAVPSIETYGLFNHGTGPSPVRVMGIPIAEMGSVNEFPSSLFLQHTQIIERLKEKNLSKEQRAALEKKLAEPPSFDLLDQVSEPLNALPAGLAYDLPRQGQELPRGALRLPDSFPPELQGRLRYDAVRHNLVFKGPMAADWRPMLESLSPDADYKAAVEKLFVDSQSPDLPQYRTRGKAYGLIVGVGVIGIKRNRESQWVRPGPIEWEKPIGLTVLDLSGGKVDASSQVTRTYYIVDDSHIGVWQYDNSYVYVPFDVLQKDLGMDQQTATVDGNAVTVPGRVTDIHIKVEKTVDPNNELQLMAVRDHIQHVVEGVLRKSEQADGIVESMSRPPLVETWQDTQRIWISAVENEKLLTVLLFGIMCIVAIFLIFCIFYMIVVEKTRDIGIIKSVGATSLGVAGIFLGYGLVIGIIGSGLGLLTSYLMVHYINQMHAWLGHRFGMQIWNPEVYLFDKIPNTMSGNDIAWIIPTAVLASVLGAVIPAIRAGRLNPVDSLRWE